MSAIEWPETPRGKLTISGAEPPLPPMIADFQRLFPEAEVIVAVRAEGHRVAARHKELRLGAGKNHLRIERLQRGSPPIMLHIERVRGP